MCVRPRTVSIISGSSATWDANADTHATTHSSTTHSSAGRWLQIKCCAGPHWQEAVCQAESEPRSCMATLLSQHNPTPACEWVCPQRKVGGFAQSGWICFGFPCIAISLESPVSFAYPTYFMASSPVHYDVGLFHGVSNLGSCFGIRKSMPVIGLPGLIKHLRVLCQPSAKSKLIGSSTEVVP